MSGFDTTGPEAQSTCNCRGWMDLHAAALRIAAALLALAAAWGVVGGATRWAALAPTVVAAALTLDHWPAWSAAKRHHEDGRCVPWGGRS
jgi:hypothetical protein